MEKDCIEGAGQEAPKVYFGEGNGSQAMEVLAGEFENLMFCRVVLPTIQMIQTTK
jgi:hypothetical protein